MCVRHKSRAHLLDIGANDNMIQERMNHIEVRFTKC